MMLLKSKAEEEKGTTNHVSTLLSDTITTTRKTQYHIENQLLDIQHKISEGYTHKQIIKELNLKERTFYYYKNKLYRQSAEIQAKKTEEILLHVRHIC